MLKESAPQISIIVPVYNVAPYLRRCLDSLVSQVFLSQEIILIDDGSTDGSSDILKENAEKYSFIHLFLHENRGAADARNTGIEEAKGKYIGFVDSDDWIEPDMFSKLIFAAEQDNADIVQCSFFHEYAKQNITVPHDNSAQIKILSQTHGLLKGAEELLLDDGTVWNRIFLREMLIKNNIRFDKRMSFGEDVFFYWTALCSAQKIKAIPNRLYHYRRLRKGSHTNTGDRRVFAYFITCSAFADFVKRKNIPNLQPWCNHLFISYLSYGYERLNTDLKQEYFAEFRKFLFKYGYTKKSPIGIPSVSGGIFHRCRYHVLKRLHPLTIQAVLNNNFRSFERIIQLRKFLSQIPMKTAALKKQFTRRVHSKNNMS